MNKIGHQASSQYASGEVFLKSFLDSLIVQTVDHPNILQFIMQFLIPGENKQSLYSLKMPSKYDGTSFEELFNELLKKGIFLLGIYKFLGKNNNTYESKL